MTPQEVVSLLKGIAQVKDYFQVDEDRVAAWAAILDSDLDYGWAMKHLARLLGESRRTPEPSDFNVAWRERKKMQRKEAHYAALSNVPAVERVPMPSWFKEQVKGVGRYVD